MSNSLTTAFISLPALRNNLHIARTCAAGSKVMAAIKADAYGHGIREASRALQQADGFFVAHINEALALRKQHPDKPIIVLSEINNRAALDECNRFQLQPVIYSLQNWYLLQQYQPALPFWLKLDTGMHRLGLSADEFAGLGSMPQHCLGLFSHLSDAEVTDHPCNAQQQQLFEQLTTRWPKAPRSLANSAAVLFHPNLHYDWVRPGIMLYGSNPSMENNEASRQLQPVMRLHSQVLAVREINAGECVGYNGNWQAQKTSRIATIAIGYGDGYPRHARNGTPISINGRIYPLVGNVSMDLVTVDVTGGNVAAGDQVELWGEHIAASTVAEHAGTISYQLYTGISDRVPRVYID